MNRRFEPPITLPVWETVYEVWFGEVPYKLVTLSIPAETIEEARTQAQNLLDELFLHLYPGATVVERTPLERNE